MTWQPLGKNQRKTLIPITIYNCITIEILYFLIYTYTLPETNIAPENGWLEYDRFLLAQGLLSGGNW